jgi:hypothetical protein
MDEGTAWRMPDLAFEVVGAKAVPFAATPLLALELSIRNRAPSEPVQSIILRCQVNIDASRRRYSAVEEERLGDLFGDPARWPQTVRAILWTHITITVPSFDERTVAELHLPCTYDLELAPAKYFFSLAEGNVPLTLLFSGSVFFAADDGRLQVSQIPWSSEAAFLLPHAVYREAMDLHYPNSAGLLLRRDIYEQLYRYKVRSGLPTWEQAFESLLAQKEAPR